MKDNLMTRAAACITSRVNALETNLNDGKYTGRELLLASVIIFLFGLVIGMLVMPKSNFTINSDNSKKTIITNDGSAEPKEDEEKAED